MLYDDKCRVDFEIIRHSNSCGEISEFEISDYSHGNFQSSKKIKLNSDEIRELASMLSDAADKMDLEDGVFQESEPDVSHFDDEWWK